MIDLTFRNIPAFQIPFNYSGIPPSALSAWADGAGVSMGQAGVGCGEALANQSLRGCWHPFLGGGQVIHLFRPFFSPLYTWLQVEGNSARRVP